MNDHRTAVLIVGGGVTGLSAALFLARQGIRPILVERHPSTAIMPQARAFNPRTVEIYRGLGLESDIRARLSILAELPEMIGADTLAGQERFRVDLLSHLSPPDSLSPTDWAMIDQDELEVILRHHAEAAGADVRFGTELVSLTTEPDGVSTVMRDLASGTEYPLHADHLIAADGNRAGIRTRLGIGADQGIPTVHAMHCVFDADLTTALDGRRFLLAYLDRPRKGTVVAPMRKPGRWMLGVPYDPADGEEFTEPDCAELVRTAVGDPDLDVALVPPVPGWTQKTSRTMIGGWVAHRYRCGRVYFIGDAAHVVPPTGSYGASTGIADAHNLAWKLAAVVNGEAGDALLDTYEDERRPVASATLETALRHLRDRYDGGAADVTSVDDLAMIFGYRYASSAILTEPGTPDTPVENPRRPSGRPGLRAPHVRLDEAGRSTLDLFGGGFTLLSGSPDWDAVAAAAARSLGIELEVHHLDGDWTDGYGVTATGASLVRPDGFVCWRGEKPGDLEPALARVLARDLPARSAEDR